MLSSFGGNLFVVSDAVVTHRHADERLPEPQDCSESEFKCKDNACIDIRRYCDGTYDCHDGSDETDCGGTISK